MKKVLPILVLIIVLGGVWVYRSQLSDAKQLIAPEEVVVTPRESVVEELELSVSPSTIRQGDPALVSVSGLGTTTVESLSFNGKRIGTFTHNGKTSAFVGIDLRMATGSYPLVATLNDGRKVEGKLVVTPREIVQAPLGIPDKLGGNTAESEKELVSTLVQEGALISAVPTSPNKLWEGNFRVPVGEPVVITDTYGYSRLTGASSISHKGTDFRAKVGTPIYAMNSGEIRFNQFLRNYGNTIIIDHGLGLHSIYMHLSESLVTLGQRVEKGQLIAKSGDTGYTLGPHLHLTIRINGISIDPQKFLELFGVKTD